MSEAERLGGAAEGLSEAWACVSAQGKGRWVRLRRGDTEATVEFCRLAGKREVGAICELIEEHDEGLVQEQIAGGIVPGAGMMRGEACLAFGKRWGIRVCTIEALVEYLDAI